MDEREFLTRAGADIDLTTLFVPTVRSCGEDHPVFGKMFLTEIGREHFAHRGSHPMASAYFTAFQMVMERKAEEIFYPLDEYMRRYPQCFSPEGSESLLLWEGKEILPAYGEYVSLMVMPIQHLVKTHS